MLHPLLPLRRVLPPKPHIRLPIRASVLNALPLLVSSSVLCVLSDIAMTYPKSYDHRYCPFILVF
jgi:hypothetical protein